MSLYPLRVAALLIISLVAFGCGDDAPPAPVAVEVVVEPVTQRDVAVTSEWIGTTEGAVDAEIRARVSGNLVARSFEEGTRVEKDKVLFRIDARPYRAALDQAQASLGRAEAMLGKASLDVQRFTPLVAEGAVSRQELDNAIQLELSGRSAVAGAKASVETARLDLSFTDVRSPISGIAGIAQAQVGDLVGPGDPKPLTNVSELDPIRVSFPLSEREYLRFSSAIRKAVDEGEQGQIRTPLELILADGSVWPHPGRPVPAASGIDATTGTILMRGEFPNPDYVLRPGQYARVRAVTETRSGALLVPQRALLEVQGVAQVAVVGADDKVELRVVEPGIADGSMRVIDKGLSIGDRVVVEGVQKVREGTLVAPRPAASKPAVAEQG